MGSRGLGKEAHTQSLGEFVSTHTFPICEVNHMELFAIPGLFSHNSVKATVVGAIRRAGQNVWHPLLSVF